MKRFITLLLLLAATLNVMAQTPANSRRPLWVGLNMGGTWQASDMKGLGGIGWGVTMSRYSKLDKNGPLYFGWRFRFLDGRNYGYNYHRLYGLSADPVLSQGATNYATPTATNDGYVYSNYKMHFDEFAYELIIGSNGLRKHGVLLYGFGGIGATHWKTTINQLDVNLNQYDYSAINMATNGNDVELKSNLKDLWRDGDYETIANGSKAHGQWNFMPSAGIGFGYQWSNAVALGVEHRTTFALNDLIDGVNHDYTGAKTPNNDIYNYDGFFVRWTFGGNGNSRSNTTYTPPPANPNTYTPNPTPVVTNPPNNNPPNNNPPNNNPPNNPPYNPPNNNTPTGYPPQVRFTTPSVEPYTATVPNQQLVVRVDNVNSAANITLLINSQSSLNFTYNSATNTMVFSHTLQNGVNVYQVTATNPYGSASDVQTIYYNNNVVTNTTPNQLPPQVTITNPSADPYASPTATTNVSATVLNVTTVSGIQVRRNGSPVTNFSFDPNTHQVNFVANLQNGNNMYEVIGTNSVGSASDHTTITYNPVVTIQPPVVTITAPASCPCSVKSATYTVQANVTNVTMASQVAILFNNQPVTNFTFTNMGAYAQVSFPVALNPGSNPFTITGTNAGGSNSKSCELNYKVTTPTVQPPVVTITNPGTCPLLVKTQGYTVQANVTNVTMASQVSIVFNSQPVTVFNFVNMGAYAQVSFPVTLNSGLNPFTITGTNTAGTDSKSCELNYRVANEPVVLPPVVNITSPNVNPFITSTSPTTVTAEVLHVTQASQITVGSVQQPNIPFTFNASTHIVTFSPTLVAGANMFTVTATNTAGTASDNTTIKYVAVATGTTTEGPSGNPPVGGRPSGAPPSITLISPATQSSNSTTQSLPVTMTVTGATSISEISVRVNNMHIMGATYDANTHVLSFNANLALGANTITVQVITANGSANTSLSVTYANSRTANPRTTTPKPQNKPTTTTTTETKAETKPEAKPETKAETKPETETKGSTSTPRTAAAPSTTAPSRPR